MDPAMLPQLISYIAPGAPARRRPATGTEAFLRAEIGFTPSWFRGALGVDFGERWHTDPDYRRESLRAMRAELLLPFDQRIAGAFGSIGVHNCAWRVDPYLEHYARIPRVGYIDMGLASHLPTVRALFPSGRRAVMITPTQFSEAAPESLQDSLQRIAAECGPCDVVVADLEAGTPDEQVRWLLACCEGLSQAAARDGGR
jgi:hypothetical protein